MFVRKMSRYKVKLLLSHKLFLFVKGQSCSLPAQYNKNQERERKVAAAPVAQVPSPSPRWQGSRGAARPCGSPRSCGRWSCSSPTCGAGGAQGCSGHCTCRSHHGHRCCQLPSGHWSLLCPGLGWEQRSFIIFFYKTRSQPE